MNLKTLGRFALAKFGVKRYPIFLDFEITHLCNLTCEYCDRHTKLPNEMSEEQIFTALQDFYKMGMQHINLDGGEPLTHPAFEKIVEWLYERQIRIHVNSNGILIKRKSDSIKKINFLKISLDGGPEQHDLMRGNGSFQKAIDGAQTALELGVPVEFRCTLGIHNVNDIDRLIDIVEGFGKGNVGLIFQPARHSLFIDTDRDGSAFVAENQALQKALTRIISRKNSGAPIANKWGSLNHFKNFPHDTKIACAAGKIKVVMDPEGNLFHCGLVSRANKTNNVVTLGVKKAFDQLHCFSCKQCWCAKIVEGNLTWGGNFLKLKKPLN